MLEEHQLRRPLRFGAFEVDIRAGELREGSHRVRLQEQPFQVLAMLLERPGEIVTREEFHKKLWPEGTFVDFDHGLNKAISKIREALKDSAGDPHFVETVARRGYRFVADVTAGEALPINRTDSEAQPPSLSEVAGQGNVSDNPPNGARASVSAGQSLLTWRRSLFGLLLLAASLVTWWLYSANRPSRRIQSLAVLPLENLSMDASESYFADGMTDELISDLGQISALRVISRTTAMLYKHIRKPLPKIARELKVDAVVEGTVRRSGDQVRITAELIEAAPDKHLWSGSYQGRLQDTLALQNQVARAIADHIRLTLNSQETADFKNAKIVNSQAYVSYLKGRYFWNKRTAASLKIALAYFNQAIEEDPNYAQAYSGLADTYALLGDWQYAAMTPKEALPKAKAAAVKALELNNGLAEAHNSLAFCLDGFDWDWDAAGREFRRAIELNPGLATAHHWYAWHWSLVGRNAEAIAEMKKAQSLDPLSLIINADLAELFVLTHSYDESILQSRRTIEMDSNFAFAHNQLGQAYLQKHMNNEALLELQKAVQLSGGSPTCKANLARACVASGRRSEAMRLLNTLRADSTSSHSHASEIATIYASLGDSDEAMEWLEKGYEDRFNPGTLLRPGLDPLRADPRFAELMRRIGLPH